MELELRLRGGSAQSDIFADPAVTGDEHRVIHQWVVWVLNADKRCDERIPKRHFPEIREVDTASEPGHLAVALPM